MHYIIKKLNKNNKAAPHHFFHLFEGCSLASRKISEISRSIKLPEKYKFATIKKTCPYNLLRNFYLKNLMILLFNNLCIL